jgi:hypothetical protein
MILRHSNLPFQTQKEWISLQAHTEADPDDIVSDTITPIMCCARDFDSNFVDDNNELQAALARPRSAKISKKKELSSQEIAATVALERVRDEAQETIKTPIKQQPLDVPIEPADDTMEEIQVGKVMAKAKDGENGNLGKAPAGGELGSGD